MQRDRASQFLTTWKVAGEIMDICQSVTVGRLYTISCVHHGNIATATVTKPYISFLCNQCISTARGKDWGGVCKEGGVLPGKSKKSSKYCILLGEENLMIESLLSSLSLESPRLRLFSWTTAVSSRKVRGILGFAKDVMCE